MLSGYDTEQTSLDSEIEKLQSEIDTYSAESVRADKFIELVTRYKEFTELNAILLNEFIDKVVVHEAKRIDGKRTMQVDIYLNFIGNFVVPYGAIEEEPEVMPIRTSKKKLRKDMSPQELERERERDRIRYAKKTSAKLADEEKRRAELLSETSYSELLQKPDNADTDYQNLKSA